MLADEFCQLSFEHGCPRAVKTRTVAKDPLNGFRHVGIVVTEKMGGECCVIINVATVFGVP